MAPHGFDFSVGSRKFKTPADLIDALDQAGLAGFDRYVRDTLLLGLVLDGGSGEVEPCLVTPRTLGNRVNPSFGVYERQLLAHGYNRLPQAYGAFLILEWAQKAEETNDCDLNDDKYFVVLSPPLFVSERGHMYLLCVRRGKSGLGLGGTRFRPYDEIGLDRRCLIGSNTPRLLASSCV